MQATDILVNGRFTPAQLELLKLFATETSEEDLKMIKQFFVQYLAKKAFDAYDAALDKKGYTVEEINGWSKEHNRTPYESYRKFLASKKGKS